MMKDQNISRDQLFKIQHFLKDVHETNEDTEYDPSQEELIESVIELVKTQGKTSIVEDFEVPFVHPMITIQKWNEELKQMTDDLLDEKIG